MLFSYRMYGLFQTTFYFGYMALFSSALGMMAGMSPIVFVVSTMRSINLWSAHIYAFLPVAVAIITGAG